MSPRVVCSWCRREMSPGSEPVSHGICPACRAVHFPARVAIPGLTPTTTLPQHTTAFAWPSSEGAGPSLVDDYYDAGGA